MCWPVLRMKKKGETGTRENRYCCDLKDKDENSIKARTFRLCPRSTFHQAAFPWTLIKINLREMMTQEILFKKKRKRKKTSGCRTVRWPWEILFMQHGSSWKMQSRIARYAQQSLPQTLTESAKHPPPGQLPVRSLIYTIPFPVGKQNSGYSISKPPTSRPLGPQQLYVSRRLTWFWSEISWSWPWWVSPALSPEMALGSAGCRNTTCTHGWVQTTAGLAPESSDRNSWHRTHSHNSCSGQKRRGHRTRWETQKQILFTRAAQVDVKLIKYIWRVPFFSFKNHVHSN